MNEAAVKEAIKHFELQEWLFPNSLNVLSGNMALAIAALKKQMPIKVVRESAVWPDGRDRVKLFCPTCHEDLSPDEKYCSECGQRLDWSENDG